jgi:hypothetical protein
VTLKYRKDTVAATTITTPADQATTAAAAQVLLDAVEMALTGTEDTSTEK